ncbi:BON domain-containing protein [Frateuria terrea]|uniref:Hyperosmotically inducible protein n=1 Tax=Frateuria terrea TaxID=529704 RepID=A0A1H6ZP00_9GAMM|nr:BON domain-containing protein [Frateuria terrea]SEJ53884.1 hyperosmotically inducible protein [Frateuria terrea]SFP81154.1 hyperosmotically inducible protein [Frateuria terrea]
MRTSSAFRHALIAASLTAALAAVPFAQAFAQDTGAQSSTESSNQTVPGKVDDAWITTKVKSEFATARHIHATDISVDTSDGKVTLTGSVASSKEKSRAIHMARKVKGVKSVDATGLTVTPKTTKSTTTTTTTTEPASSSTSGM